MVCKIAYQLLCWIFTCTQHLRFENYVNYAGSKTHECNNDSAIRFENYVNYAGSKTDLSVLSGERVFENYVNYAGSKTVLNRTGN